MPGLQQAIHNGARQSWESPTHARSTIEVRLQGRRTLTETHTQRKAYLTERLQGVGREQRDKLLRVMATQIFKANIHVRMHAPQASPHSRSVSKIDLIKYDRFIA
jgi:phage gp46-like protein